MTTKIVIDTNILFSSMLSKNSYFRKVIFENEYKFYAPNYVAYELFKHKEKILKHSKASEDEVYDFILKVYSKINFYNKEFISDTNWDEAYKLCFDVDENDTPILALALELEAQLWTGDEKLRKGLVIKGYSNFFQPK